LILAAVIIIAFLALAAGNAVLFLAGAAGGFLSRVMRALKREDLPLDYGASWTTLFLSPLFGALAGWFGVAVIELATSSNVKLLGEAFNIVDWYDPLGPATLGVAFMLGFSERFFDAVVGAVDRHAAGAQAAQQAALVGATPPPSAPGTAGAAAAVQPPPSAADGVRIDLPDGPLPVTTVGGKVILDKPAPASTGVILSTSNKQYTAQPSAVTIAAGETEAEFDVVPTGQPPADKVRITARVGNVSVSDTIDYQ
jgi:hypothetical protein